MTETAVAEPKNITEAIARIMGELPAIGKDSRSENVPYTFRGIETITGHAQGLCARYGVVFYPRGEITQIKDITVNQKPWTDTVVSVRYKVVHGPSNTHEWMIVPAIGRDNSDKGSNKGMTQAFKYALIQAFMIADPKEDGDRDHAETGTPRRAASRVNAPTRAPNAPRDEASNFVSQPQLGKIAILFGEKGIPDDKAIRHAYVEAVVGHSFESTKELTKREGSQVIEALQLEDSAPIPALATSGQEPFA